MLTTRRSARENAAKGTERFASRVSQVGRDTLSRTVSMTLEGVKSVSENVTKKVTKTVDFALDPFDIGHHGTVTCVKLEQQSSGNDNMISGCSDGSIKYWDVLTGNLIRGIGNQVTRAADSANG